MFILNLKDSIRHKSSIFSNFQHLIFPNLSNIWYFCQQEKDVWSFYWRCIYKKLQTIFRNFLFRGIIRWYVPYTLARYHIPSKSTIFATRKIMLCVKKSWDGKMIKKQVSSYRLAGILNVMHSCAYNVRWKVLLFLCCPLLGNVSPIDSFCTNFNQLSKPTWSFLEKTGPPFA